MKLTWPHEPAAYQAQMLAKVVPQLRQAAANGQAETGLCIASFALPELQYADYPYALDPKIAAYKRAIDAKISRFQSNMMNYNTQMLRRGEHN